jgi:hypothetical protein
MTDPRCLRRQIEAAQNLLLDRRRAYVLDIRPLLRVSPHELPHKDSLLEAALHASPETERDKRGCDYCSLQPYCTEQPTGPLQ